MGHTEGTIPPPLILPGYSRSKDVNFHHVSVIAIGDGGIIVDPSDPSNTMILVLVVFSLPHISRLFRGHSTTTFQIATDGEYWWHAKGYWIRRPDRFVTTKITTPKPMTNMDMVLSKRQVAEAIKEITI